MTPSFALFCALAVLQGVFCLGPVRPISKRVALKTEETFVLKLSDIPRSSTITVVVANLRDSLEIHIASPKEKLPALENFGLVEGENLPWLRDFGRISGLIGWYENIWSAETWKGAFTISHLYHDLDPVTRNDAFEHVVLLRAKPPKIDNSGKTRCVNNVVNAGHPGARLTRTFSSGFIQCPLFLLSNYPLTTLSQIAFKGTGSITVSKVAGLGVPLPLFSIDNASDALWAPTAIGAHAIGIHLPIMTSLNVTISVSEKMISQAKVGLGAVGVISSFSYVSQASYTAQRRLQLHSEFPAVRTSPESFEIASRNPLLYRLKVVDIDPNANFSISTDYGRIPVQKNAGWSANLVASRIRVEYVARADRGFLLQYSVSNPDELLNHGATLVFSTLFFVIFTLLVMS